MEKRQSRKWLRAKTEDGKESEEDVEGEEDSESKTMVVRMRECRCEWGSISISSYCPNCFYTHCVNEESARAPKPVQVRVG